MPTDQPIQLDEMVVSEIEQARALWDSGFLSRFLDPASPSDVARSLGIAANLAHHRARRHLSLGLLMEVKRENRKVYYQLVARTFRYPGSLIPPRTDQDSHTGVALKLLRERFLEAYDRSTRLDPSHGPIWHVHGFTKDVPQAPEDQPGEGATMLYPAHFQARTLRLSPERYRALLRRMADWLEEAEADEEAGGQPCTITLLGMAGGLFEGVTDGQSLASYLPVRRPDEAQAPQD